MKRSTTETIGVILGILGILILVFLKNFSQVNLGGPAVIGAGICIIGAFCLFKWKENSYRFDANSIPVGVKIVAAIVGMVGFLYLNLTVCEWRLGGAQLVPNIFPALVAQSMTLLLGAGIYIVSYPQRALSADPKRVMKVIAACVAGIVLLNFIFHSNIGGLTAGLKPVQRCYPGGTCYDAGYEQWGGGGALVLLTVNLLQGMLVLNALAGLYGVWRNPRQEAK